MSEWMLVLSISTAFVAVLVSVYFFNCMSSRLQAESRCVEELRERVTRQRQQVDEEKAALESAKCKLRDEWTVTEGRTSIPESICSTRYNVCVFAARAQIKLHMSVCWDFTGQLDVLRHGPLRLAIFQPESSDLDPEPGTLINVQSQRPRGNQSFVVTCSIGSTSDLRKCCGVFEARLLRGNTRCLSSSNAITASVQTESACKLTTSEHTFQILSVVEEAADTNFDTRFEVMCTEWEINADAVVEYSLHDAVDGMWIGLMHRNNTELVRSADVRSIANRLTFPGTRLHSSGGGGSVQALVVGVYQHYRQLYMSPEVLTFRVSNAERL